jgi:hypothetical protein
MHAPDAFERICGIFGVAVIAVPRTELSTSIAFSEVVGDVEAAT